VLDNTRSAHLAQSQKVLGIRSGLALLPTQRAAQNEQIAVYRASLASAELNLARSELRLPFTARVSLATVEEGQFVKAGQTIASFDGIEAADVEAQVSVADLSRLLGDARAQAGLLAFDPESMSSVLKSLGIEATVRLQLGSDVAEWPATLDRISNVIDPKSGTLGVIVRVENAYGNATGASRPPLTKGLFVEVELSAPATRGTVIPRAAFDQGRVLLADSDGRLVVQPVVPALVQGEIALVKEGLPAGSRVVVSTPRPVIPGMLLSLTVDEALMQRLLGAAQ
jgi:multidrug efflux pump subunit AcrA (membrane-fusion protein)